MTYREVIFRGTEETPEGLAARDCCATRAGSPGSGVLDREMQQKALV